jgi:hypothetical protein
MTWVALSGLWFPVIFPQGVALGCGWVAPLGLKSCANSFFPFNELMEAITLCQAVVKAKSYFSPEFSLFNAGRLP